MSCWKPIETAPRDGTYIIGFLKSNSGNSWDIKSIRWASWSSYEGEQLEPDWVDNDHYMVEAYHTVTHWMPIQSIP